MERERSPLLLVKKIDHIFFPTDLKYPKSADSSLTINLKINKAYNPMGETE